MTSVSIRIYKFALILMMLPVCGVAQSADSDDLSWPRKLNTDSAEVLVYQPQPESFGDDILKARAAIAVTLKGQSDPAYGSVWLSARVMTDREHRTATLRHVEVTRLAFPDAETAAGSTLETTLQKELSFPDQKIDLDELIAALGVADVKTVEADNLNNTPPEILTVDHPALLVSIDGEPVFKQIPNSEMARVTNTPFMILFVYRTNAAYLFDGRDWLVSADVMGPWKASTRTPPEIVDKTPLDRADQSIEKELQDAKSAPKVIVVTKPTELVAIDGAPQYKAIDGTDLSYVSNTQSRLLKENSSGTHHLLLSGRWYAGSSLEGPWSYLPADQLPADFAKIPPDSEVGEVLANVPGTQQARDAVIEASLPYTTTVPRHRTIAVHYDGPPRWDSIEGTGLDYAINSPHPVIRAGARYLSANEGVWYGAEAPVGPWGVATEVPDEIYTIPPSNPLYNVTYLHVFGYDDDEVYPGYYPGYYGSYIYGGIPVYGTGYDYRPWAGAEYYSRPATWGFHVHYNSTLGWSFGYSYRTSYFPYAVGYRSWDPCCWWGPSRFGAGGPFAPRGPIGPNREYARRGGYYARGGYGPRGADLAPRAGARTGIGVLQADQFHSEAVGGNNLYSGRDGRVYRHSGEGWQRYGGGAWSGAEPSRGIQSDHAARSRGMSMSRGGGGRRR